MFYKLRSVVHRALLAFRRSRKWPALRRVAIISAGGRCEACGGTTKLTVHHIVPFHVDPTRELDPRNLIVLCERQEANCHLRLGHGRDWDMANPNVVEDARMLRMNPALQMTIWSNARDAAITRQTVEHGG